MMLPQSGTSANAASQGSSSSSSSSNSFSWGACLAAAAGATPVHLRSPLTFVSCLATGLDLHRHCLSAPAPSTGLPTLCSPLTCDGSRPQHDLCHAASLYRQHKHTTLAALHVVTAETYAPPTCKL
jgi:hypothetical protein